VLAEIDRVERLATSLRAKVVMAERGAGTWSLLGDRDLAGFLGRESHQGRGVGSSVVGQAETLSALPAVAEALVDGPVTPRHLQEITRATASSPRFAAELATRDGQAQVVELARRFDGSEFGRQLKAMSASVDPATRQRQHDEQRANRYLNISHSSDGTLIKCALDSVAGHKFAKMIDGFNPRPATDDERSPEQRRADALMVAVDRALADRRTTPGSVAPVQAIVTLSEETWAALRGTRRGAGVSDSGTSGGAAGPADVGSTANLVGRLRGAAPVLDETGQAWPASEIGRALCDCALTRVVVGAFGQVLDLGRSERLFQRQHWLALYGAGVRTCGFSGCGMPLRYTELHHLAWWDRDGGRTDLDNCAAYCSFHHHEIHRLDIRVTRLADGTLEHRHPDGRLYGGAPPLAEVRSDRRDDRPPPGDTAIPARARADDRPPLGRAAIPAGSHADDRPTDLLDLLPA
jgi:hypothetical protein